MPRLALILAHGQVPKLTCVALQPAMQGISHVLLEQYQEAEAALLEGLSLDPRHDGMLSTMAAVTAALEPEPASPTSPAASTPKRSA